MARLKPPTITSGQSYIYIYGPHVFKKFKNHRDYKVEKEVYDDIQRAGKADMFCMPLVALASEYVMVFPKWDCDLFDMLNLKPTVKQITMYLVQVAACIEALHSIGKIHGDIKAENILIKGTRATIIDMVDCRGDDFVARWNYGTLIYQPPEYQNQFQFTIAKSGDIWTLGVIHYAALSGRLPYAYPYDSRASLDLDLVPHADSHDILKRCLDTDPTKRPTIAEVKADYAKIIDRLASKPRDADREDAGSSSPKLSTCRHSST